MLKTCPFCRTKIDSYACVCPNCTQPVSNEPPTIEEKLRSLRATSEVDGFGIIKVIVVLSFAVVLGMPLLPVLCVGGVLIGLTLLAMHAIRSINTGDRHDG